MRLLLDLLFDVLSKASGRTPRMEIGTAVGHIDAGGISTTGSLRSALPASPVSSGV